MFKAIIFLTTLGCFYATTLYAAPKSVQSSPSAPPIESVYFNVGTHTEFYNAVQIDDRGNQRKFQVAPTLGIGLNLPIDWGWRFLPELNWVLPFQGDTTDKIIKNIFMFRADFGYDLLSWLRPRIGTSLMVLNQHGRGGSAQIDNGNGTSTFYYPDENRSSVNNTFDLGLEFLYQEWSVRFQSYTYALFKKEQRQLSYTIFLSYDWDM